MCQFSVSGVIRTDKISAPFDTGVSNHITTTYSGNISAVAASVKALCNESVPLPSNNGTIMQMGNKYVVALGLAQCKPSDPSKLVHTISITFADEGVPSCTIQ